MISETVKEMMRIFDGKFRAMTGANNFVGDKNWLRFRIPRYPGAKQMPNLIECEYIPDTDLYKLTFGKVHGMNYRKMKEYEDVYAEDVLPIFEDETGLKTRL